MLVCTALRTSLATAKAAGDGTTIYKECTMAKVSANKLQGEGNYEAAEQFNKAEQAFIKSGKVATAAPNTAPKSPKEAQELLQAEQDSQKSPKGAHPKITKPAVTSAAPAPARSGQRKK
jgi:hypothetical protein